MILGVIFDFNGVIVDDYPIQKQAWDFISQKLRSRSCTDEEMLKNIRGVPTGDVISWMSAQPLQKDQKAILIKQKEAHVTEAFSSGSLFRLNNGFPEFCDELKEKNILNTIATSSSYQGMRFAFQRLGLERWFTLDNIVYNDGSYPGKPAPDAYLRAVSKLKLQPKNCVVFEDASSGAQAAYGAGIKTIIAVGSDDRLEYLKRKPGIAYGIHDFTEMNFSLLKQLLNSRP